jgi:hypothetical protein
LVHSVIPRAIELPAMCRGVLPLQPIVDVEVKGLRDGYTTLRKCYSILALLFGEVV